MTLAEAIDHLRMTVQSYQDKRKTSLAPKDILAIVTVLTELHRKDRI
jgi:hypothetical protein